ncbi:nucleosome-binding protein [Entamoeba histolytica HM-3:IMSS]|uniref:Nucleosome-binding protein n=4 Tax=Entamoeba histolytica TaxID=5759 RepID=C4M6U9_ENTH1|nr:hypothetical protein EHI_054080 [Entamoeba histolytica HM-1:IMSS]EAL46034.1 hypothetical protein EHI_054080 [Entamoeba histolytica HM-1:IMSS]EMD46352.1 nucleosome-binding protein, putative [Entamoeba histolytica KU27]EMS14750.1 nucleosome-binding protein [Entamoeba histolytica HM-3:IMSS]|eukprot:XP_651419.1 hypothetical protein EHI_054080 [Entamoeba histolytica HM-1:IMSS]
MEHKDFHRRDSASILSTIVELDRFIQYRKIVITLAESWSGIMKGYIEQTENGFSEYLVLIPPGIISGTKINSSNILTGCKEEIEIEVFEDETEWRNGDDIKTYEFGKKMMLFMSLGKDILFQK